jgi:hypothetical protein
MPGQALKKKQSDAVFISTVLSTLFVIINDSLELGLAYANFNIFVIDSTKLEIGPYFRAVRTSEVTKQPDFLVRVPELDCSERIVNDITSIFCQNISIILRIPE